LAQDPGFAILAAQFRKQNTLLSQLAGARGWSWLLEGRHPLLLV